MNFITKYTILYKNRETCFYYWKIFLINESYILKDFLTKFKDGVKYFV